MTQLWKRCESKMDYSVVIKKLKALQIVNGLADNKELAYLKNINVPEQIIEFYRQLGIVDSIEVNGVELLSVDKIKIENIEAVPGLIIFLLGYCVIASTLYGDVYCIKRNDNLNDSNVFIASHDEIYEGLDNNQIQSSMISVCNSFTNFLEMFLNEDLAVNYYELTDKQNM